MKRPQPTVAWLSPMGAHSAIGRYTSTVVPLLEASASVDVWAPRAHTMQTAGGREPRTLMPAGGSVEELSRYDFVVYNMGNSCDYHAEIFEHYLRLPGVVVMHDLAMSGFFETYARERLSRPEWYMALMAYVYGREGEKLASRTLVSGRSRAQEVTLAERFPLFEPCLWNATGLMLHSRSAAARVSGHYGDLVPTKTSELPYFDYSRDYSERPWLGRPELDLPADKVVILASGWMDTPKRVARLLEIWGSDTEVRERSVVVIAGRGSAEYMARLHEIARDLDGLDRVRFVEGPTDHLLHSYMNASDLISVMRLPCTETASASLVESIHFGKPVLLTDTGPYAELPGDVFAKVDPLDEEASIRCELRRMVLDVGYREALKKQMERYRGEHHDPAAYCGAVMDLLRASADAAGPLSAIAAEAARLPRHTGPAKVIEAARLRAAALARSGL